MATVVQQVLQVQTAPLVNRGNLALLVRWAHLVRLAPMDPMATMVCLVKLVVLVIAAHKALRGSEDPTDNLECLDSKDTMACLVVTEPGETLDPPAPRASVGLQGVMDVLAWWVLQAIKVKEVDLVSLATPEMQATMDLLDQLGPLEVEVHPDLMDLVALLVPMVRRDPKVAVDLKAQQVTVENLDMMESRVDKAVLAYQELMDSLVVKERWVLRVCQEDLVYLGGVDLRDLQDLLADLA